MTMTTTQAAGTRPHPLPRASSSESSGAAPLRNSGYRVLQVVLFVSGAVMLPLGLVVIILGWYGAAHTPYQYDQISYLVSGGLFGLGLTFCGGFLYFGAWLARIATDGRDTSKRLSDTLLTLADVVSRSAAEQNGRAPLTDRDPGGLLVIAGRARTVHRRDCPLVADRDDVRPAGPDGGTLTPCRVCKPGPG